MEIPVLAVALATIAILTAHGLSTSWRLDRSLAGVLSRVVDALSALDVEQVRDRAEHEHVRGAVIEAQSLFPALDHAWTEWEETLVDVQQQPRTVRSAGAHFAVANLLAGQSGRRRALMPRATLRGLPAVLTTAGAAGGLALFVVALLSGLPLGPPTVEQARLVGGHTLGAVGLAAIPFGTALLARVIVRLATERWAEQLEARSSMLIHWLDRHYRSVSQEELLARMLGRLEAIEARLPSA